MDNKLISLLLFCAEANVNPSAGNKLSHDPAAFTR